jgi:hypothetical protein
MMDGDDANQLESNVDNLMDVAQGTSLSMRDVMDRILAETIETKNIMAAPRQVILQEDSNGNVIGGTSEIRGE